MAQQTPKVLLFDIGGVCVASPLQAILDYETSKNIPPGYINFSISRGAPQGSWHRLERGEIALDAAFFDGFKQDLSQRSLWEEFHNKINKTSPGHSLTTSDGSKADIPDMPDIDAESLFWQMIGAGRYPDRYMYPALKRLKASGRFVLAALSNTVIFPPDHPLSRSDEAGVRSMFDLFMSSAHIGMRKPDPRIYEYAIQKLKELAREKDISNNLTPDEIVFLDDIGENLKFGQQAGMRTIRVKLGGTRDAVKELERVTDLNLLDGHESKSEKAKL